MTQAYRICRIEYEEGKFTYQLLVRDVERDFLIDVKECSCLDTLREIRRDEWPEAKREAPVRVNDLVDVDTGENSYEGVLVLSFVDDIAFHCECEPDELRDFVGAGFIAEVEGLEMVFANKQLV